MPHSLEDFYRLLRSSFLRNVVLFYRITWQYIPEDVITSRTHAPICSFHKKMPVFLISIFSECNKIERTKQCDLQTIMTLIFGVLKRISIFSSPACITPVTVFLELLVRIVMMFSSILPGLLARASKEYFSWVMFATNMSSFLLHVVKLWPISIFFS